MHTCLSLTLVRYCSTITRDTHTMINGISRTLKFKSSLWRRVLVRHFALLSLKIRFRATWQHAGITWIARSSGFSSIPDSIKTMRHFSLFPSLSLSLSLSVSLFLSEFFRIGIIGNRIETLENLKLYAVVWNRGFQDYVLLEYRFTFCY